MLFGNKVTYSVIFSTVIFIIALTLPVIPCNVAPLTPNPEYSWSFCSLNPENACTFGLIKKYYGYTTSLTSTYFLTLITLFILSMLFLHFVSGRIDKRR